MAMMLLHAHATVTVCHSKTRDLAGVCRSAEILVAAMGRPAMLTGDFIGEGAVVIDPLIDVAARDALRGRWRSESRAATRPGWRNSTGRAAFW